MCLVKVFLNGRICEISPIELSDHLAFCNYFSRFALMHPHFLLRPTVAQELIIQAIGKLLYNTFINPYGNLNVSFALIRTTERLAVESALSAAGLGLVWQAVGSGTLQ